MGDDFGIKTFFGVRLCELYTPQTGSPEKRRACLHLEIWEGTAGGIKYVAFWSAPSLTEWYGAILLCLPDALSINKLLTNEGYLDSPMHVCIINS